MKSGALKRTAALVLLALVTAVRTQAAEDPKASAKRALAIRAAAQDIAAWIRDMASAGPEERQRMQDDLAAHMTGNVVLYRSREEGWKQARSWIAAQRQEAFDTYAGDALARAREQSPLPLDLEDVWKMAGGQWDRDVETAAASFAAAEGPAIYAEARPRAVDRLGRQLLNQQPWPDQQAADAMILALDGDVRKGRAEPMPPEAFRQLASRWSEQLVSAGAVFEELDDQVDKLADAMAEQIGQQYRDQSARVEEPWLDAGADSAALIRTDMVRLLLDRLNSGVHPDSQSRPPRYGVFTAVSNLAADVAAEWERRSIRRHLVSDTSWMPGSSEIMDRIRADLPAHRTLESSLSLLVDWTVGQSAVAVRDAYAGLAPDDRRGAVRTYLETVWEEAGGPGSVHREAARSMLEKDLPEIRRAIAAQQLKDVFPALEDGDRLPENVIAWLHGRNRRGVENFGDAWGALSADDTTRPAEADRSRLLEETRAAVTESLNRLAAPGIDSMMRQLTLIGELEADGRETLRKEAAAGRTVDELLEKWTRDWRKAWERANRDVPVDWRPMFDVTSDRLNKTVRQWYDSLKPVEPVVPPDPVVETEPALRASPEMTRIDTPHKKEEEKEEQQDPSPDEPKPQEEPPETALEPGVLSELMVFRGAADGVLSFSDLPDGSCRLLFGAPDGRGAIEVAFEPDDIEGSARLIADALRGPLHDVLNGVETSRGGFFLFRWNNEPKLSMLFRVDSPAIRHQMSIMVREFIAAEIKAWSEETGEPAPELLWQDEAGLR